MITNRIWLVGFEFRTERGCLIQHFYLVADAANAEVARQTALRKAHSPGERALRGGLDFDETTGETRQVVSDLLGVQHLSGPRLPDSSMLPAAA